MITHKSSLGSERSERRAHGKAPAEVVATGALAFPLLALGVRSREVGKSDNVSTEATPGIEDWKLARERLRKPKQRARGCLEPCAAQIGLCFGIAKAQAGLATPRLDERSTSLGFRCEGSRC